MSRGGSSVLSKTSVIGNVRPVRRLASDETVQTATGSICRILALDMALDIPERLCRSEMSLSLRRLAQRLDHTVGAPCRMATCLVEPLDSAHSGPEVRCRFCPEPNRLRPPPSKRI